MTWFGEIGLAQGDHFFVWRNFKGIPFQHHGIDVGDGTVVHFGDGSGGIAGPGGNFSDFEVCRVSLADVDRGGRDQIHVVQYAKRLPPEKTVARAIELVGRRGYDLLFDNCEHFAVWCACGVSSSRQVHVACERVGSAGVKVAMSGVLRSAGRLGVGRLGVGRLGVRRLGVGAIFRGATPWIVAADAAQWATEALGHHVGLREVKQRRRAGRAVGMATSLGVGMIGGPAACAIAGGLWLAGEMVGEASRLGYDRLQLQRLQSRSDERPGKSTDC